MGAATRLVVLGGSSVATPELVSALAAISGRKRTIQLVLTGRSPDKLERVAGAAGLLAMDDTRLSVSSTTDVAAALEGANLILNQVDQYAEGPGNRSAFIELAVRTYIELVKRNRRDRKDLEIINRLSDKLNREALDVLEYQAELPD